MNTGLVLLLGMMSGGLVGVAVSSALVAMRTLGSNDWLSPGLPDTSAQGEPRGPQGTGSDRLETGVARTPGPEGQPGAARTCEDSRPSRRAATTATRPTPTDPPRRDRRNPSAGWARLSLHAPICRQGTAFSDPASEGAAGDDETEQWTWG